MECHVKVFVACSGDLFAQHLAAWYLDCQGSSIEWDVSMDDLSPQHMTPKCRDERNHLFGTRWAPVIP